ncbi:ABC transporter substrate-binding protein [Streptomyces sp. RP5T]|uniref:ABC transporter substrate-binding protein n=1 Tax=Streptomyces sp. RP5T TaxID=2490848 RepID=UPI000F651B15|nr:ABC transporter substrate-binding protein [Streptomyces sp. RP5T]RRR73073.1 ribose ABC transporter substrate-binding protein [Streptomyces sp. RP5T]
MKITTVLAAGLTVMAAFTSATACSSADGSPASTKELHKLVFIQGVAGDGFYVSMKCGIEAEAKKLGATVTTQGPAKFDPTLQTPIVQSVVASHPDAILIAPTDISAMQTPIAQAKAAGIKVVLVDTTLKDPSVAVSSVSSDNLGGGKAAFKAIKQLAPTGGKVLTVSVQPGISTADDRTRGFSQAAKADPAYKDLGVQYDQNDPAKAAQIVTAALQKDPDIVGIFATNLFSAEGAATGVRQAGRQKQVKIVGFDADPAQVSALKEGTVQALVAQQPQTIGVEGVKQAVAALKGKTTTSSIKTGFSIINRDNLDSTGQAAIYKTSC